MRTISLHVSDADWHPLDAPSLRDVRPVDLGPMLQPFDRSGLADEMYQR